MCSICQEPFDTHQPIIIVKHTNDKSLDDSRKRNHYFHRNCIEIWKKQCITSGSSFCCPLDRDEICKLYTVPQYEIINFDLNYYDSDLLKALQSYKGELVKQLESVDEIDKRGKTLAYYACYIGEYSIIVKLLSAGANFNKPINNEGFTPLMAAVCQNHQTIVSKLLSNKTVRQSANIMDISGMTAFMYACKYSYNLIITDFMLYNIPSVTEVRNCLQTYKKVFDTDILYGKEIIHKMLHYLKPKI
jgi:hypothetical protein